MSVSSIMASIGIPQSVWQPIMDVESGGNANAQSSEANGTTSYGLFQLNSNGVGANYSSSYLLDPTNNATLAGDAMKAAVVKGQAQGLSGYSLTQYVAFNSGFPTEQGVSALNSDPVVQAYNPVLQNAYNTYASGGGASTATTSATTTSAATSGSTSMLTLLSNLNQTQKTGGTASIGYTVIFSVLGIGLILLGVKMLGG